jgi:hypothetical protein
MQGLLGNRKSQLLALSGMARRAAEKLYNLGEIGREPASVAKANPDPDGSMRGLKTPASLRIELFSTCEVVH